MFLFMDKCYNYMGDCFEIFGRISIKKERYTHRDNLRKLKQNK